MTKKTKNTTPSFDTILKGFEATTFTVTNEGSGWVIKAIMEINAHKFRRVEVPVADLFPGEAFQAVIDHLNLYLPEPITNTSDEQEEQV